MIGAWRIEEVAGVVLVRCAPLLEAAGIVHAFSTRAADGGTDFDMASAEHRARFLRAAGLGGTATVLRQVHGARIVRASAAGVPPEADAALWLADGEACEVAAAVRTADCVPILLADASGRVAAAVHAGWKGTAAGIAREAVAAIGALGAAPASLFAALGPAILPCCYEVGAEVAQAVARASGGEASGAGRGPLDLHDANRRQLVDAGLRESAIHAAPWCTRCRGDLFFSYRRDGAGAGRMMAAIGAESLTVDPS